MPSCAPSQQAISWGGRQAPTLDTVGILEWRLIHKTECRRMSTPATLEALLSHVEESPVPLARLARVLLAKGDVERALELCKRAVALAPDNGEVRALAAEVFSHQVPLGYFPMVQDSD